jgi:eukaryotic-like serine/threonine-protein kinase
MALTAGTKLGHYQITDLLGKGGMGEVYRARDAKLGREVAIKALPTEFEKDAERLARFEREARMLAALNHPNIAAIYGLEQSDATRFLVLELIEGDTLADRLKLGAIPVDEALKLALQIAEALEAAHEKGVIHRDLKPANIKITPDGKVKVLDFGLAKAYMGDAGDVNLSNSPTMSMAATQQGLILGTAGYMSPEQANGEVADKRADIWSFGVVLFEMLTGRPLFTGKTVSYILADVLRTEPNWKSLPANLHPRVRMILERSLEKEAKNRLSGISDARVEIQKALVNPADSFAAAPVASPTRSLSLLPWIAAVVLAAVTGVAVWSLRPIEQKPPVSRWSYVLPEGSSFRNPGRAVVDISADGSQIVYNAVDGLYIRSIGEFEARKIQGTEGPISSPTFSPDGQWIAFFSGNDRQIRKIAIAGGAAVPLAPVATAPDSISWDIDNTILFTSADGIWRLSASGGNPERIVSPEAQAFGSYAQLLPGANAILSNVGGGPGGGVGQIGVYSIQSRKSKLLFPGSRPRYLRTGHIVYVQSGALFAVAFDLDRLEVKGGPVSLVEGIQLLPPQYSMSESGALVYIANNGVQTATSGILSWVDQTGVQTPLPVPPMPYRQPRLSPDGTRVAVYTESGAKKEIWVYDLDGKSQIQRLAGEGNNSRPIWTPDSQRLTFTSDRKGAESIWWQPADGSKPAEPITEGEKTLPHWPDAWTPDGKTLAFTKYNSSEQSIWALSPGAGSKPQFVAGGIGTDQAGGADFSPDGKWIAYRTNVTTPPHIQLQPFPTTGARWDTASEGGAYPMWSKDGRHLFYRRQTAAAELGKLAVIDISIAGGSPRFTNERILPIRFQVFFGNRDYDITKDGKRLMVIVPEGNAEAPRAPARPQINVVLNWLEELKSRVPSH